MSNCISPPPLPQTLNWASGSLNLIYFPSRPRPLFLQNCLRKRELKSFVVCKERERGGEGGGSEEQMGKLCSAAPPQEKAYMIRTTIYKELYTRFAMLFRASACFFTSTHNPRDQPPHQIKNLSVGFLPQCATSAIQGLNCCCSKSFAVFPFPSFKGFREPPPPTEALQRDLVCDRSLKGKKRIAQHFVI